LEDAPCGRRRSGALRPRGVSVPGSMRKSSRERLSTGCGVASSPSGPIHSCSRSSSLSDCSASWRMAVSAVDGVAGRAAPSCVVPPRVVRIEATYAPLARLGVRGVALPGGTVALGGDGGRVGGGASPGGRVSCCSSLSRTRLSMAVTSSGEHAAGVALAWSVELPDADAPVGAAAAAAAELASASMHAWILSTHCSQVRTLQPQAVAACAGDAYTCGLRR